VLPHFWIPEDTARAKEQQDRVPYRQWAKEGFVTLTPGNQVDDDFVIKHIDKVREIYDLQEVAFDRWGTKAINKHCENEGIPREAFGQGYASMSPAAKNFEKAVLGHRLIHGNNPVLRWNATNAAIKLDEAENIKPVKDKSTGRIDGIVAAIMALERASVGVETGYWSPADGVAL
jgi:phage terminase large subunit-like protein